jgi:hypothetical protein
VTTNQQPSGPCDGGRPFLCDADVELPAGWVRGDPAAEAGPTATLAYDPRRHTVARCVGDVPAETAARMAAAGFDRMCLASGDSFFVRDRTRPTPTRPVTRPATQGRQR